MMCMHSSISATAVIICSYRKTNQPDVQREGHDALLLEYEEITADPDGLLGHLENLLGTYKAKQLMCQLFQVVCIVMDLWCPLTVAMSLQLLNIT